MAGLEQIKAEHPMRVFLSHISSDTDFAKRLASDLKAAGYTASTYFDTIAIGESVAEKIASAILDSDVVIILLSRKSAQNPWVSSEIALARAQIERGKRRHLIPIVIQKDSEIPFFIKDLLYLDLSDEDKYRRSMPLLIQNLKNTEAKLLLDKIDGNLKLVETKLLSDRVKGQRAREEMIKAQELAMNVEKEFYRNYMDIQHIFISQVMRMGSLGALLLGVVTSILLFYSKITWTSILVIFFMFFVGMSVPISIFRNYPFDKAIPIYYNFSKGRPPAFQTY